MLSYPPLGRAVYVYGVSVFGALTCSKRRTVVRGPTLPVTYLFWKLHFAQSPLHRGLGASDGRSAGVTTGSSAWPCAMPMIRLCFAYVWPCAAPKRPRPSAQPRTERDTPHQTEALMERQVHDSQPISRRSPPPRARARNQHKDLRLASMPDARSFSTIISGNGDGSACEPT